MKTAQKYYISSKDILYIEQFVDDRLWGWFYRNHNGSFMQLAQRPRDELDEVSEEDFSSYIFMENL